MPRTAGTHGRTEDTIRKRRCGRTAATALFEESADSYRRAMADESKETATFIARLAFPEQLLTDMKRQPHAAGSSVN